MQKDLEAIKTLVEELKAKCILLDIPFFFSAAKENEKGEVEYYHEMLPSGTLEHPFKCSKLDDFIRITQGYLTIHPTTLIEDIYDE